MMAIHSDCYLVLGLASLLDCDWAENLCWASLLDSCWAVSLSLVVVLASTTVSLLDKYLACCLVSLME
jgi:hypothetical protein